MPAGDGTGPQGTGPIGRGQGRGLGVGRGIRRNLRATGTKICTCPKCGHSMNSQRGIPCTEVKCEKCGALMKGQYCA